VKIFSKLAVAFFVFGGVIIFMKVALDAPEGFYDAVTHRCIAVVDSAGVRPCQKEDRHQAVMVETGTTYRQIQAIYSRH
jgi:hypothetical protein